MGLPMISCSYFVRGMTGFPMNILPLNRSLYDQFFLYLVMAYLVFLWPAFPISAFLCLRSYIYTWHKWSSYICSSHHWFSYEQPSYHCVPIFAFLWLRLPISMSSCGKGWLRHYCFDFDTYHQAKFWGWSKWDFQAMVQPEIISKTQSWRFCTS